MSESVKVFGRFRPLNSREKALGSNELECDLDGGKIEIKHGSQQYKCKLDGIFDGTSTQTDLYESACRPSLVNLFQGYNGTVFAYGQTGSGKTFSMYGPDLSDTTSELCGFVPRFAHELFEKIENSTDDDVEEYRVSVSYLELYNEMINDLLEPMNTNLKIRMSPNKGVYVDKLSSESVTQAEDIFELLELGAKNRKTASTKMNARSSRSHCVFIIMVEQKMTSGKERCSKINLVDLAGSEKIKKTGATGATLKEAQKINLSLTCLGMCIKALTSSKKQHVPFRDSKLTRILQESLGGNTKTTLLVCLSPHHNNYDETVGTLRFAERAKTIQNKAVVNETASPAIMRKMLKKLQQELEGLKQENARLRARVKSGDAGGDDEVPPIPPAAKSGVVATPPKSSEASPSSPEESPTTVTAFDISSSLQLAEEKQALEAKIENLQDDVDAANKELQQSRENKAQLEARVKELQATLDSHDKKEAESQSKAAMTHEALSNEIAAIKRELEVTNEDLEQCHEREQDLKKRLDQANADANKAMASASAATLSLEQKQSILLLNQRHCKKMMDKAKAANKAKHAALKENEVLRASTSELERKLLTLVAEAKTREEMHKKRESELLLQIEQCTEASKGGDKELLKVKQEQIQKLSTHVLELQGNLQQSQAAVKKGAAALEDITKRAEKHQSAREELSQSLSDAQAEVEQLQLQVRAGEKECRDLRQITEERNAIQDMLKKAQTELQTATKELNLQKKANGRNRKLLKTQSKQIEKLQNDLFATRQKFGKVIKENNANKAKLKDLEEKYSEQQEQVQSLEDMQSRSLATLRMRRRVRKVVRHSPRKANKKSCVNFGDVRHSLRVTGILDQFDPEKGGESDFTFDT